MGGDWPIDLHGVTESVVTTPTPEGRWNLAALGVHAPETGDSDPTSRTWGHTRTRRNFSERGVGYVQFTRDPITFTEAALTIQEHEDPLIDSADAWVRVEAERIRSGMDVETSWVDWRLLARESGVECRRVPTTNRGFAAIVEATVAASRLDTEAYDSNSLASRLDHLVSVVETCGGQAEHRALDVIRETTDW